MYLVVANWKMNPQNLTEAKRLFNSVEKGIKNIKKAEVVICPPFPYLLEFSSSRRKSQVRSGAQDCFWEQKGAFTGEVSPLMLKNLGVEYVIVGHSERRKFFKETDETVNKKIKAALDAKLKPIMCVANLAQLKNSLRGISQKVIIAFEPLSAIGAGKPYNVEKARKMRAHLKHPFVLYGGSVNSQNASDYIKKAGFQGLLVGGASLRAGEFVKIVKTISRA